MEKRLDKILSEAGVLSRKECRELAKQGQITVNGSVVRSTDLRFDPDRDEILVRGESVDLCARRYLMLYKPCGVLSATEDAKQKTVLDLLPEQYRRQGLFPVGRLDKDTSGLLLLTNDGDFAHRVISPAKHVPKVYEAEVAVPLSDSDVAAFREGLVLADGLHCLPAALEILSPTTCRVTVFEGKYHQVRRMLASRGKTVLSLHRCSIGSLTLDPALSPGGYRLLTESELVLVFE